MPERKAIIAGQRGGKSFQAGYNAGYAQCKLDIANELPSTEEMKWLRKLKYAILRGEVDIKISSVNPVANQSALESYAKQRAVEVAEEQEARYIKHLKDTIDRLTESSRPDWTPCAERMPEKGEVVLIAMKAREYDSVSIYVASRDMLGDGWVDRYGECVEPCYSVLAWQPLPAPYNHDHKEERQ